jgi:hypothetical protein
VLTNAAAQDNRASGGDFCGPFAEAGFGLGVPTTRYDPELLTGWGKRFFNWEFSAGVQHEVLPRVSLDVSYFRRWYGNFNVSDNLALGANEFDTFSLTAPSDARLPGGGGYSISGFKNQNPSTTGRLADNFTTLSDNYGKQTEHWNGVDVGVNARLAGGFFVQGGTSTGRTSTNNCEILQAIPEVNLGGLPYCDQRTNWLTQVKGAASYTVPRIDVQASATYQYLPGPEISANWAAPASAITPQLGRPLFGNAANQTVNLVTPGTTYNAGLNQLDLRFAKILRFGGTRTTINFDLYNATNANTILALNNAFVVGATGNTWQIPNSILQPRFFKFGAQFDW